MDGPWFPSVPWCSTTTSSTATLSFVDLQRMMAKAEANTRKPTIEIVHPDEYERRRREWLNAQPR